MSLSYDFGGVRHEITRDEIDAIERSGKSGSVFQYALCPPSQWNDGNWGQLRHMGERPGQTEPGTMPVQKRNGSTGREMFERTWLKPIHWLIAHSYGRGTMSACQGPWARPTKRSGGDGFSSASFRNAAHSARACPRCVELFNEHNQ